MDRIKEPSFINQGLFYYTKNYEATWLLLNYINLNEKYEPWSSFDEANLSFKPYRYSILGLLSDKHKINSEYEFLLEYPEHNGYNRWYQELNPLYDIETAPGTASQTAKGYRKHTLSWEDNYFSGLKRSCYSTPFLDGTRNSDYNFYSIGRIDLYKNYGLCSYIEIKTYISILWVRIPCIPNHSIKKCLSFSRYSILSYIFLLS